MKYSYLRHLVGGYFHEDWCDEYAESSDAVDDFVKDHPEWAHGVPGDIEILLSTSEDDAQVEAVLDKMGLGYYVYADGYTSYGGWLSEVARRIELALLKTHEPHPRSA